MSQQATKFTERVPHPAEFPLGSVESRAAARAQLDVIESGMRSKQLIIAMPARNGTKHCSVGQWYEQSDGSRCRVVMVYPGVPKETLARLLAMP